MWEGSGGNLPGLRDSAGCTIPQSAAGQVGDDGGGCQLLTGIVGFGTDSLFEGAPEV